MPTAKTATKKTVKTAEASIGRQASASQRIDGRQKPAPKTTKKVTLDDVWETIREIGKAHTETEAGLRELQQAHKETEKALKETQRIVGDLGNKFGDEAEYTMIPGLPEKFKQFGFDFGAISRNRKINNDKHDIHAEIDAFLENGTQAMAVEVKAKLQTGDVDDHIKRMEKIRKHADLVGDKRELFGALAATIVQDKPRDYALENGFYVIEPSGEDVKVIKPGSDPRVW
ncbi:hypothetical protein AGMMS50255_1620 [Spirochaetia bacterium]|nr:hypothetical protein AGMMS50255_1620 [Spirochaetia bacterium]